MMLGALKYGYNRFEPLCRHVRSSKGDKVLVIDDVIMGKYEPVLRFYCRDVTLAGESDWQQKFPPGLIPLNYGEVSYFFLDYSAGAADSKSPGIHYYGKKIMGPVLFSHLLYYKPRTANNATSTFIPGPIHMKAVVSDNTFEMRTALKRPSYQLEELPPGMGVFKRAPRQIHDGAAPLYFQALPPELPAYEYEVDE